MSLTAVRYISSASGTDTIATMPAHQKGDLLVAVAFIDSTATPPSLGAGWTNLATQAGTSCSMRVGWMRATGSMWLFRGWARR